MKKLLWLMGILSWNTIAFAQSPIFKMLRYDENWTSFKKDTSNNWYNHLKYSPVGNSNKSYISVGGEVRFQYFTIKNEDWGDTPADKDGYHTIEVLTLSVFIFNQSISCLNLYGFFW